MTNTTNEAPRPRRDIYREITDRINAIQDVGSKREEILKANDRFGPRPSYRSARDFGY